MKELLFSKKVQNELAVVQSMTQVGERLEILAREVEHKGKRIGMVVGRISPLAGELPEAKLENKRRLGRRADSIARMGEMDGVEVFSSADIPDELEKLPPEEFYAVLEDFVRKHVRVLVTTQGWEQSRGAVEEVRIARERRLEIYHFEGEELKREAVKGY